MQLLPIILVYIISLGRTDPLKKIIVPNYLVVSELRQAGSLIFDFNEYLNSIREERSHSFKLLPKAKSLRPFIALDDSGQLILNSSIDHEYLCMLKNVCTCGNCIFNLELSARSPNWHYFIISKLKIEDSNDHIPEFSVKEFNISISEDSLVGSRLNLPTALDRDYNSQIKYEIDSIGLPFVLEENTPILILTKLLDREQCDKYNARLSACDEDIGKCSSLNVNIIITDINDNIPKFKCPSFVTIPENAAIGSVIVQLESIDKDLNDTHYYSLSGTDSDLFSINEVGNVIVTSLLDYENKSTLSVQAIVKDSVGHEDKCTFEIKLINIDDNLPEIRISFIREFVILENETHVIIDAESNSTHGFVSVHDLDGDSYKLEHVGPLYDLYFNNSKYSLISKHTPIDRWFTLVFKAGKTLRQISVQFSRRNRTPPIFSSLEYQAKIDPSDLNFLNVQIKVWDNDNDNITIHVLNMSKQIKSNAYTTLRIPNILNKTTITMFATDNGHPCLNSTAIIKLPDCAFASPLYKFSIVENTRQFGPVRLQHAKNVEYRFYPNLPFRVNANGYIESDQYFDRELNEFYRFSLHAIVRFPDEQWHVCATTRIELTVLDVNDNAPIIHFPRENEKLKIRFSKKCIIQCALLSIEASDLDVGLNGDLEYILNNKDLPFVLTNDGTILYTSRNMSRQVYTISVTVRDMGSPRFNHSVQFLLDLMPNIHQQVRSISLTTRKATYTIMFIVTLLCIFVFLTFCLVYAIGRLNGPTQTLEVKSLIKRNLSQDESYSAINLMIDPQPNPSTCASGDTAITRIGSDNTTNLHENVYLASPHQQIKSSMDQNQPFYSIPQWLSDCDVLKSTLI